MKIIYYNMYKAVENSALGQSVQKNVENFFKL